jgi:hypothetical protein
MDGTCNMRRRHYKYALVAGNRKWRGYAEDMGIDGRIILISTLEKQSEDINFSWMRMDLTPSFCERGTQTPDYLKAGHFFSG